MKAALLHGVNDLRVVETALPKPNDGDVLVRISVCGVCPTDVRKYRTGDDGALTLPMNLGHEWVGEVVEGVGHTNGFRTGMRVIGDTFSGYAEYALISAGDRELSFPNGALRIPDELTDEELTFVEPLADCLHAILHQAQVERGQTVVVCGAGQLGLQLAALASWRGAHVIVSEPLDWRRELAREFGAENLVNPLSQDPVEAVQELTSARGADAVIVATGVPLLLNQSLQMARQSGRVVLFAGFQRPSQVELDPNLIHYNELVLTGSYWIGNPPYHHPVLYQKAVDLIAQGVVPVKRLITSIYPLEQITQALEAAADRRSLKVIVHINGGSQ